MDIIIHVFETSVQYNCSHKSLYTKTRAEILTLYIESSSVDLTQRAYRRKYRGQRAPCDKTIRRLVFVEHGTVGDRQHVINDQDVPINCLKRTQKCRIVAALSSLALVEPLCGVL
nr:unnamed protein product [Callosobruchus analis]